MQVGVFQQRLQHQAGDHRLRHGRGQGREGHADPGGEAHILDGGEVAGVGHLLLQGDLLIPGTGDVAEIFPQLGGQGFNGVGISQLRQGADGEQVVVQEVGIDLGLQLLQLCPLGADGLHVHLLDQFAQALVHLVETLEHLGEVVVPGVMDPDGKIAALHPGKGLGQLVQRLVDAVPHVEDIAQVDQNQQQDHPDENRPLQVQHGEGPVVELKLDQGEGLGGGGVAGGGGQVALAVGEGDLEGGGPLRKGEKLPCVKGEAVGNEAADQLAIVAEEENHLALLGADGGEIGCQRLLVQPQAEQVGGAVFLEVVVVGGVGHHDVELAVHLNERLGLVDAQAVGTLEVRLGQRLHPACGDGLADGGRKEAGLAHQGGGIGQHEHAVHHPQHGQHLLGLGVVARRDAQAVDVLVIEQLPLHVHGLVQGQGELLGGGVHLGGVAGDNLPPQGLLAVAGHHGGNQQHDQQHGQGKKHRASLQGPQPGAEGASLM